MKREIKFRVWDCNKNSFLKSIDNNGLLFYPGEVIEDAVEFGYLWDLEYFQNKDFDIQQYTGLMDRNGIEIYEGDIVKLVDLNYKVFWDEWKWNASCPYYHPHHYPQFGDRFFSNARCSEVIGNIYENGDLLK